MRIVGLSILTKLKSKNLGNAKLVASIDKLLKDLENNEFSSFEALKALRKDADKVHGCGACFFNISVHRTMILIHLGPSGTAEVLWAGTHQEYESVFQNNRATIEKWLRGHGIIR